MKIYIKSGPLGARKAKGIGVVIDVFRASSTIVAILLAGAKYILPVKFLKEAYQLKKENPGYLLIGERRGLKPKWFDYGNSPYEVLKLRLKDKIVIFRSSSGSHIIIEALKSKLDELLIGSFTNAKSIANYIKEKKPDEVSLITAGTMELGPYRKAIEDELCARYIKGLLEEKELDFSEIREKILESESAGRLRKLGQERDLEICLSLNLYNNIIPKVVTEQTVAKIKAIIKKSKC
jgi:2-phosphosulfolactate phosphatase